MPEVPTIIISNKEVLSTQELMNLAFDFAQNATAKNTQRTYSFGWRSFYEWCRLQGMDPYITNGKEALIAFYISEKAANGELKVSSISCYLAAIRAHFIEKNIVINMQHPSIQKVLKGIRNSLSKRPVRKEPILTEDLRQMIECIPIEKDGHPYLNGLRDRAILLLGFAGAFRRSELVGLNIDDLTFTRDGFVALVRKSKTDQEGEGLEKAIPYGSNPMTCPVRALKDWLEQSKIDKGAIFRAINRHGQLQDKRLTGHAIAFIIKRNAYLKEKQTSFSGHSLRAGFVTAAAKRNVPEDLIMKQSGHKSSNTVKMYIRRGKQFEENAASLVGL
jgi:integrase